jgi:Ca2+-binding EF-hand superfamily protein
MVFTSLCYLIIQGPAFVYARRPEGGEDVDDLNATVADTEHWWSLIGLIVSSLAFCGYIGAMVKQSQSGGGVHQKLIDDAILRQLEANPQLTLSGLIGPIVSDSIQKYAKVDMPTGLQESLLAEQDKHRLKKLLAPFFYKYDVDGDGSISQTELIAFLNDLGERPTRAEAAMWMTKLDTDNTGSIEQDELVDSLLVYVKAKVEESRGGNPLAGVAEVQAAEADEDDEDEELEMPEEFEHLSPDEQQSMIKRRSFKMMGIGTLMVIIFSDPMVDVMANVGNRLTIPPFYVAFILAPLASNASEFIASFAYAGKKSKKTITVALAALEGAACMNNTFCLAIFMGLCYFKQLAWKFSAETSTTLLIEVIVALFAMRKTQTCYDAVLILSLFPISVAMIAGLEAIGFD